MIISIDRSPDWKRPRPTSLDWARLLEALFLHFPDRRPASRMEVLLLSDALHCPEVVIEKHRSPAVARLQTVDPIPSALRIHDAGLHRVPDKIGNVMRAHLGHNPCAVKLHGLHRDV
jgi:hypothetical protein